MLRKKYDNFDLIAIDPGLANLGWARFRYLNGSICLIEHGIFCTEKSDKKRNLRASSDNIQRLESILVCLNDLFSKETPNYVAIEEFSHPRNSSSASKYSLLYGGVLSLCLFLRLEVIEIYSKDGKFNATGKNSASKEEVIEYIKNKYNVQWADPRKDKLEHQADAINIGETAIKKYIVKV